MTKSRLSLIITIAFSSILLISIVVLAILQTNTKPNLPSPDKINIYNKELSTTKTYSKDTIEYNEILRLYNSMFEKTYLSQIADDQILTGNVTEDPTADLWSDNNKRTGLYIEFEYETTKKFIIYRDGSSRRVDIKSIFIPLSGESGINPIYLYYTVEEKSASDKDKTKTTEPNYPLVVEANTYDLTTYVKSLL